MALHLEQVEVGVEEEARIYWVDLEVVVRFDQLLELAWEVLVETVVLIQ